MNSDNSSSIAEIPKNWNAQQKKRRASFLQSAQWALFQKKMGNKVYFLAEGGWSCLLIERRTPLGKYLFAPYGPTLDKAGEVKISIERVKTYARQLGADWITLEPMISAGGSQELNADLEKQGGKKTARNREPGLTRLIDLEKKKEDLLAGISQSTRSIIRKNQREGLLSFSTFTEPKDIGIFINMLSYVTDRKKVFFYSDEYFTKQAEVLMPAGMMHLEIALKDGKPVASALFHDFGETSTYTYAASLPEARETSASALLLWQAMLNAKERRLKKMDLFGIAPDNAQPSHPWHGFSAFKKKFGGEVVAYSGTWEFPISTKYRLYTAARRIRARR